MTDEERASAEAYEDAARRWFTHLRGLPRGEQHGTADEAHRDVALSSRRLIDVFGWKEWELDVVWRRVAAEVAR